MAAAKPRERASKLDNLGHLQAQSRSSLHHLSLEIRARVVAVRRVRRVRRKWRPLICANRAPANPNEPERTRTHPNPNPNQVDARAGSTQQLDTRACECTLVLCWLCSKTAPTQHHSACTESFEPSRLIAPRSSELGAFELRREHT